jgi:fatty acid desaturase
MCWGEDMMPTATAPLAQSQNSAPGPAADLARVAYRLTADLAKPNAAIYWADLLLSAAIGYGTFAAAYILGITFVGAAAALISVLTLYRCIMFIHELTHLRKRTPRFFWTAWHVLVGVPLLLPSFLYEGIHNLHHAKSHYGTEGDPEYLQWARGRRRDVALMLPISAAEPLLLVLRFLFVTPIAALVPAARGYVLERMSAMVMNPRFKRTEPPPFRTAWLVLETLITLYAWTVLILVVAGIVPLTLVLLALAIWSAMSIINMVRTLAAHHYENDGEPIDVVSQLLDTVNVPPPALLPMLWAPVGLRYHGLHHLLPNLPYHSLGRAHRRLLERLPADSPYRATLHRRISDVLARMFRNQAQARRAAKAAASGAARIVTTTR